MARESEVEGATGVSSPSAELVVDFRRRLLRWWRRAGREFFWREGTHSSFDYLVVEMLLSKSLAERVDVVAPRVLARWPTPRELADAEVEELESELYELGLQRKRALLLKECARALVAHFEAKVPFEYEDLVSLPYVGPYTANAVRCFAFGLRSPILDANVARVYSRVFGLGPPPPDLRRAPRLWRLAERMTSPRSFRGFNWAILDLGGTICVPQRPRCAECPVKPLCSMSEASSRMSDPQTSEARVR